ncbi:MAG TPA: DegT/DnrJ/EryC1/StrS family aminotransferase [Bryobacteraceae bacterium]|jgi:dTDP-4-amino-4,6-dideoxygalactose transaminase|nr:DegT/DnrJ/EryC1/StrS family aminotransferase [Bryobacteraceae bacterium]
MTTTAAALETVVLPSDQDATGRTLGEREIELVTEAIRTGTLTSTKGNFVRRLEKSFAEKLGVPHAIACSSGTAAIHAAISAIDPEPGDEIITTPITDMGALTPILYQTAIPVFADVDPDTLNVTAATIEPMISPRTRAIVVTHLFGNPCEMGPILDLAAKHNLPVIEDSAQAFQAEWQGRLSGTMGTIGCFSLQQGKHMTCGEGGIVTTHDEALARRMFLFVNKCWGYGDASPDHYYIALNSRLTELQGAVALGQFEKLDACVANRESRADELTRRIRGLRGIRPFPTAKGARNVYWKYCLIVDSNVVPDGAVGLAARLKSRGISSAPRYIQKPAFQCEVFRDRRTFGNSQFPFNLARPEALDYNPARYPGTFQGLDHTLVLPWNENYTADHVDYIATSLEEVMSEL